MVSAPLIPFSLALRKVLRSISPVPALSVKLLNASGRVLREGIKADRDLPPFNRSAMDGYAVRSVDFQNGIRTFRVLGALEAGSGWKKKIGKGECVKIMTGAPVPAGLDAVVQVELSKMKGGTVEFSVQEIQTFMNVHKKGADTGKGALLLKRGSILSSRSIAVAASVGAAKVSVSRPLRVAVISTGRELVPASSSAASARIRDCNSPFLLSRLGALPWVRASFLGIVEDDPRKLEAVLKRALKSSDAVIVSGGVSMGDADHTPGVLARLKVRKVFHKSAIRPGKPVWFGMAGNTAVFGLPGNPVSVAVTFHEFALPGLKKMAGFADPLPTAIMLPLGFAYLKKHSLLEFRIAAFDKGRRSVSPVPGYQGSGDFVSASKCDGVIVIPESRNETPAGARVEFHPWGSE